MTDTTFTTEDHIRYTLGAVGANLALLSSTEISRVVQLYPDEWRLAAAALAEGLAARALNDPDSFGLVGVMNISWGDRAKTWLDIAKTLRAEVRAAALLAVAPAGIQAVSLYKEQLAYEPEYAVSRMKKGWR